MRTLRAIAITLLTATALAGAGAATALAHDEVISTRPSSGSSATTSITKVSVTFSAPIRRGTLRVVGPDDRVVSVGAGGRDPRKISRLAVGLKSSLRTGSYKASWTAVAADGHQQHGSFRFRLRR